MTLSLVFVIGATNAGKSTLINAARELGCCVVEVGKMMRAKYPPEYFKGSAAPEHTDKESWGMLLDGLEQAKLQGPGKCLKCHGAGTLTLGEVGVEVSCSVWCKGTGKARHVVFIDGQPRTMLQFERAVALEEHYPIAFCHLWAPKAVREERTRVRDANDPGRLALSLERLEGDLPALYNITVGLQQLREIPHTVWDTSQPTFNPITVIKGLVRSRA